MFRRALAPVIGATALTVAMLASPASGAAPNRTTITVTCDRETSHAVAVVTMFDRVGGTQVGDPTTVVCGTDTGFAKRERVVVENPSAVGAASIGGYDVTIGSLSTSCTGEGTLTFELACTGATGDGAKVTVR
ncbi:MAG TPA: hypothetical protein VFW97_02035 [Acidimicrobiia bacterium]|jgi:hypothetical protein|nr:hypothetical protein [Acidimicrobiia bacterium]